MNIVGIDPGFSGAIAVLDKDGRAQVWDTPVLLVKARTKTRQELDVQGMGDLLRFLNPSETRVAIEKATPMPKQGIVSTFRFGCGYGIWLGILGMLGLCHEVVTPQRWKGVMLDGQPKEKEAGRLQAQRLFPEVDLSLKKHHGRADALLIAEWLRRQVR